MKLEQGKLYVAKNRVGLKWTTLAPGEILMVVKEATKEDTIGLLMYKTFVSEYTYGSDLNTRPDTWLKPAKIRP